MHNIFLAIILFPFAQHDDFINRTISSKTQEMVDSEEDSDVEDYILLSTPGDIIYVTDSDSTGD